MTQMCKWHKSAIEKLLFFFEYSVGFLGIYLSEELYYIDYVFTLMFIRNKGDGVCVQLELMWNRNCKVFGDQK